MTSPLVFSSATAPRSQATSDTFRQYGITGEVASPIREVAIAPVSRPRGFMWTFLSQALAFAIQTAFFKIEDHKFSGLIFKSILGKNSPIPDIFSTPDIVVSFGKDDNKEDIQSMMAAYGFRKESSGARHYYRGQGNVSNVQNMVQKGGSMDAYAPYGATNIHGYSALKNIQKILLAACSIWEKPISNNCPFIPQGLFLFFRPSPSLLRWSQPSG